MNLLNNLNLTSLFAASGISLLMLLYGEKTGNLKLRYIFKPLTIFLIILVPLIHYKSNDFYLTWILAGLFFSMIGDICLMFKKGFLHGLIAFLIGHIGYIGAFTSFAGFHWNLIPMFILFPFMIYFYKWLIPELGKLKLPVMIYILFITLMGWQAWALYLLLPKTKFLLSALAAVLFIISDSILAVNKFKKNLEWAQFIILPTYFTAQWLFALSAIWSIPTVL